jgi:choline dehydrogenase-like flavoprotein
MDENDVADILIIGAGTSAGVAAKHLAEAGLKVVCLEQGDWISQSDIPGDKIEFELLNSKQWSADPNTRGRRQDYPTDLSESDVATFMFNGVGGTSILWGAIWPRPMPSDFRVRTLDGVADDWPISYEELQPFYEAMDLEMGVSGLGGNPAYPPGIAPPLPPLPIHKTGRRMAEGMNSLGWHWWPGTNAIPSKDYGNQKQCVRYGLCRFGCPHGSKASTDITHFPIAQRHGAQIITGARVAQVTINEKGLANGAIYIKDGKEHFQAASTVILAASGIGTPRILLMSTSNQFPDGLANSSGLVGKNLMLHPPATVVGLYEEDLEDWIGPAGEFIGSMQFYESDPSRGFVRGAKWMLMPTNSPLTTVDRWTKGPGVSHEPFWGKDFAPKMKSSVGHMLQWAIVPEDLPEESNRVTLSPDLKDSDGLPAPKIHYRVSENTRKMLDFHIERAFDSHQAAGAYKWWVGGAKGTQSGSGHNTGTARMGNDPASSVVDRWGRAHDVPNLYIIDGSVFVTSTGVNVTPTICALAKRTATFIADNAKNKKAGK